MDQEEAKRVREALSDAYLADEGKECVDAAVAVGYRAVPEIDENLAFFYTTIPSFGPVMMREFAIQIYLVCEQFEYDWEKDFRRI